MSRRHVSTHRIVCWAVSGYCSRACRFCLSRSSPRHKHPTRDPALVVDRLRQLGVKKISYSGGEPFLYPEIERTVRYAHGQQLEQIVTTNGDALANGIPSWVSLLQYLKLSFYGSQYTHDFEMGSGHYEALMSASRALKARDVTVGANYMVSTASFHGIEEFLLDASINGISNVLLMTYKRSGRLAVDRELALIDPSETAVTIAREFSPLARTLNLNVKVHDYSEPDFYVLLDADDRVKTPRYDSLWPHVLGNLFENRWVLADGTVTTSTQALESIWLTRFNSTAIIPLVTIPHDASFDTRPSPRLKARAA